VLALGAATLADIFEPKERGTMMGVYYTAPLLGPSLGSIIGGALAQVWTWRATFWFLFVWSCICFVSFLFFRDTFRKERSLTYQAILTKIKKEQAATAKRQNGIEHNDHSEEVKTSDINAKSSKQDFSTPTDNVTDIETQRPVTPPLKEVNLSLTDLNPVTPILHVLRRLNNICILLPSGKHLYFSLKDLCIVEFVLRAFIRFLILHFIHVFLDAF
jgi:MFS family permease